MLELDLCGIQCKEVSIKKLADIIDEDAEVSHNFFVSSDSTIVCGLAEIDGNDLYLARRVAL